MRSYSTRRPPAQLTHLTSTGAVHMVPLGSHLPNDSNHKPSTLRTAIAVAFVCFSNPSAAVLIRNASLKKGDVMAVARVAGIMAAKRTSELVPLCHNITIGGVEIDIQVIGGEGAQQERDEAVVAENMAGFKGKYGSLQGSSGKVTLEGEDLPVDDCGLFGGVRVSARVQTFGQTGVEMEALTAVSVAALTIYDMCKAVDKGMRIEGSRVVLKEGGRSGTWREVGNA